MTMVTGVAPRRALTDRRADTHRRLLDAATKVVARRGFHAATVDEIAAEAGFSVGAIYSNFRGKDELFLAVFDGHMSWFQQRLVEAADAPDTRRAVATALDSLASEPDQLLVFIEFWAYAVRKPKLRRTFAARLKEIRATVEDAMERQGADPSRATLLLAVIRGLGIEKLADPDAVGDDAADVIAALFARRG